MPKQRLEKILSKSLKKYSEENSVWYMKIQNNPLAHKQTPGDFLILTNSGNTLIECKETKSGRFSFNRLTQLNDLLLFYHKLLRNHSFVLFCFWEGTVKKSDFYLIGIKPMKTIIDELNRINKKSITKEQAKKYFFGNEIKILKNGHLDLKNNII